MKANTKVATEEISEKSEQAAQNARWIQTRKTKIMPTKIAVRTLSHMKSKANKQRETNAPYMVATDFLRFLQQRTGWMGPDGCLVPAEYCHEFNAERSYFSIALQKAYDYLVQQGMRPDQPLSPEARSAILDNCTNVPEFENLRKCSTQYGKVLAANDFRSELRETLRLHNERVPVVQKMLPANAIARLQAQKNLGLMLEEDMTGLWGSRRQYAFGKTAARLLFHHQATVVELNPIFTMMLFPMGGAKGGGAMGHKLLLKAHYYTDDVQNPAVIKGVMFDAFDYLTKFHDIKINYSPDIRIHVQPDLQMLIGDGSKKGQMHWSWQTFNKMLAQRQKQHKIDVGENILQEAIHNPGREFLKLLSHEQQPWYCHDFQESRKDKSFDASRSQFSRELEIADNYLFDQGLHPVFGIVQDGKVSTMTPQQFVDKLCNGGSLPKPLYNLLQFTINDGKELCQDDFKMHLREYVKVVKMRAPVVKRKAIKQARAMIKKYKGRPSIPRTAKEMLQQSMKRKFWTVELADGLRLGECNISMWGSRRQYGYGQTVARLLYFYKATSVQLTPVFAMMMLPTGGIVGPANRSLWVGDVHDSIVCHAIVHDAFGYLYTFHKLGPGYNYLNTFVVQKSSSPLCCQFQGWYASTQVLKRWRMLGNEGRKRRKMFIALKRKIPSLQTHEELELTTAFSRRLVNRTSIPVMDRETKLIDLDEIPETPTSTPPASPTTSTSIAMSSEKSISM